MDTTQGVRSNANFPKSSNSRNVHTRTRPFCGTCWNSLQFLFTMDCPGTHTVTVTPFSVAGWYYHRIHSTGLLVVDCWWNAQFPSNSVAGDRSKGRCHPDPCCPPATKDESVLTWFSCIPILLCLYNNKSRYKMNPIASYWKTLQKTTIRVSP
jgi:hypothetical protein